MRAYQFKISLEGSQPLLWRRCLVPVNLSLLQFSAVIQLLFGWSGSHQAFFSLPDEKEHWYANVDPEEMAQGFVTSKVRAAGTRLDDFIDKNRCFFYTYDFGDNWQHRIEVESLAEDYPYAYPQVQKAVGDNPLEGCGGVLSLNAEEPVAGERMPLDLEETNAVLASGPFQPQPLFSDKEEDDLEGEAEETADDWRQLFAPDFVKFMEDHEEFRQMTPAEQCQLLQAIVADSFGLSGDDDDSDFRDFSADGDEADEESLPAEDMPATRVQAADGHNYECVDVRLEDTLEGMTKQNLQDIAEAKGISLPKNLLKDEYRARLVAKMLEPDTVRCGLLWLSREEMATLLYLLDIEPPADFEDSLTVADGQALFGLPDLTLMGYAALSLEEDVGLPKDVAAVIRRLLTEDFWQEYRVTMWMEAVLSLAEDIYQVFPLQVFMKVLRRQPDFALSEDEVLKLLATMPPELQHFYFHEGVLRTDKNLPSESARLIILAPPPYYIPSIEDVWRHDIFDAKGNPILQAMFARLDTVWDDWQEGTEIMDVLTPMMQLLLQNVSKDDLQSQFISAFDATGLFMAKSVRQGLWRQIWPFFRRLRDHVRLPANHGFSNDELREQKRRQRREENAKRRDTGASQAAKAAKKSNKVISLAERRRRRNIRKK